MEREVLTAVADDIERHRPAALVTMVASPAATPQRVRGKVALVGRATLPAHAYVVIVTRGHTNDLEALRALAPRDLRYLGLIGSRAKVARIYDELTAHGTPPDLLKHVHAPIGLDIGAVTPQEIAVSILAELIAVKHGKEHPAAMKWVPGSLKSEV